MVQLLAWRGMDVVSVRKRDTWGNSILRSLVSSIHMPWKYHYMIVYVRLDDAEHIAGLFRGTLPRLRRPKCPRQQRLPVSLAMED